MKDCRWYLDTLCCKDLDAGIAWNCTCYDIKERKKIEKHLDVFLFRCPYPKLESTSISTTASTETSTETSMTNKPREEIIYE